jgi:hypothetical protein
MFGIFIGMPDEFNSKQIYYLVRLLGSSSIQLKGAILNEVRYR